MILCSGEPNRPLGINRTHKHPQMAALPENTGWKTASLCINLFTCICSKCNTFLNFFFNPWIFHCPCCCSVRSSVCRMSSRGKISVQDQSKERGVSGGLELNEDRESSPGEFAFPTQLLQESALVQLCHEHETYCHVYCLEKGRMNLLIFGSRAVLSFLVCRDFHGVESGYRKHHYLHSQPC